MYRRWRLMRLIARQSTVVLWYGDHMLNLVGTAGVGKRLAAAAPPPPSPPLP